MSQGAVSWPHDGALLHSNRRLPLWLRVVAYAGEGKDQSGHRRLFTGELSNRFGVSPKEVSRAIRAAVDKGVLDELSSARCLVLVPRRPSYCGAVHRRVPDSRTPRARGPNGRSGVTPGPGTRAIDAD